jgi:hypothetical protein
MKRRAFLPVVLLSVVVVTPVWSRDDPNCTTQEDKELGFSDLETGLNAGQSDLLLKAYNQIRKKAEHGKAAACATGIALYKLWQFEQASVYLRACAGSEDGNGDTNESYLCRQWLMDTARVSSENMVTEKGKRVRAKFSSPQAAINKLVVEARSVTQNGNSLMGTKLTVFDFPRSPINILDVDLVPGEWTADADVVLGVEEYALHCNLKLQASVAIEMVIGGQLTKGADQCSLSKKSNPRDATLVSPPQAATVRITAGHVQPRHNNLAISAQLGMELSPGIWGARKGGAGLFGVEGLMELGVIDIGVHGLLRAVPDAHITNENEGLIYGAGAYLRLGDAVLGGAFLDGAVWFAGRAYHGFRPGLKSSQRIKQLKDALDIAFWETVGVEVYPDSGPFAPHYVFAGAGVALMIGG